MFFGRPPHFLALTDSCATRPAPSLTLPAKLCSPSSRQATIQVAPLPVLRAEFSESVARETVRTATNPPAAISARAQVPRNLHLQKANAKWRAMNTCAKNMPGASTVKRSERSPRQRRGDKAIVLISFQQSLTQIPRNDIVAQKCRGGAGGREVQL